eukprot:2344142-Pyramimonas_sp.AAC.1
MANTQQMNGGLPAGPLIMQSNTKTPPSWDPARESSYPLRDWITDIRMWEAMTDIPARSIAPAVVLQLSGLAREISREVPPDQLQDGVYMDLRDGAGHR